MHNSSQIRPNQILDILLPYFRKRGARGLPRADEADLCQQADISRATLRRYHQKFMALDGDKQGVAQTDFLKDRLGRQKHHNLPEAVEHLIQQLIDQHWLVPIGSNTFRPHTLQAFVDLVHDHCRSQQLPCPGYNTLKRRLQARQKQDPRTYSRMRDGHEKARVLEPRLGNSPKRSFGERIQMDGTLIDFYVKDGRLCARKGHAWKSQKKANPLRFWITVAIDEGTSLFLHFRLTEHQKSAFETLQTLRGVLLNQQNILTGLGVQNTLPPLGLPLQLFTDRGSEFVNHAVKHFCSWYGIEHQAIPSSPHLRGRVERLIGLINEALRHLPGSTLGQRRARGKTGKDYAVFSREDLERYLAQYLMDRINVLQRKGGQVSRLQQAWTDVHEGKSRFTPLPESQTEQVRRLLMPIFKRTLQQTGLHWQHRRYISSEGDFLNLVCRRADLGKVTVLFDPHNIQTVWLIHPDTKRLLPLQCVQVPLRTSLWAWEQAKRTLKVDVKPARSAYDIYQQVIRMREADDRAEEDQSEPTWVPSLEVMLEDLPRFQVLEAPPQQKERA